MFKNKIYIFFLFLIIISCATSNKKNNNYPDWYLNPPQNDSVNLYGIGEGYNLNIATKMALKDISEKIMVSISSETNIQRSETKSGYEENFNSRLKQKTQNISFKDYSVMNTEEKNKNIIVLVKADRLSLITTETQKLQDINTKIEEINSNSLNKNELERIVALISINKLVDDAIPQIDLVVALNPNFNDSFYRNKYKAYNSEYNKLASKITLKIDANTELDKKLANVFKEELSKNNLVVTNDSNNTLKIRTKVNRINLYNNYLSNVKLNITLLHNGRIIKTNNINLKGSSAVSYDMSDLASTNDLSNQIKNIGLFKILKME